MLEDGVQGARRLPAVADEEARRLGHDRVGTEHLLLAMLVDPAAAACAVLRDAGVTLEAARDKVAEAVPAAGELPAGELPRTARATRALQRAARFARQQRRPAPAVEDVLLGVLDVEGLACQVLRGLGVDVAQLRAAVLAPQAPDQPDQPDQPDEAGAPPRAAALRCPCCGAELACGACGSVVSASPPANAPAR